MAIELTLGAEAPPAQAPSAAMLAILLAQRNGASAQPPKTTTPETPAEELKMENQQDALANELAAIDVPQATADTTLPEEAGIVVEPERAKRPPMSRGSGDVDYREGGSGVMYPEASPSDKEVMPDDEEGTMVEAVVIPHVEVRPSLDSDGNQKVSKAGKPMTKKVSVDGTRYVKLSPTAVEQLTDDAASSVLHHILHTVDGHLAAQGVCLPAEGAVNDKWLASHFGVDSISEVIASLLTPWTLTGKGNKVSIAQKEALLCNIPVEGINPAQFITNAHNHLGDVFKTHYTQIYGKDAPATAVKQASDVTLKLLAAYEKHDKALAAYSEYEFEVQAAEEAGTELPKAKRKPRWKTPTLKVTLPAILDMQKRIEAATGVLRTRLAALRAGKMPKNRDQAWVDIYLSVMPGILSSLVYTKCILDGVYMTMKAAEDKRAEKELDNLSNAVQTGSASSMVADLEF